MSLHSRFSRKEWRLTDGLAHWIELDSVYQNGNLGFRAICPKTIYCVSPPGFPVFSPLSFLFKGQQTPIKMYLKRVKDDFTLKQRRKKERPF